MGNSGGAVALIVILVVAVGVFMFSSQILGVINNFVPAIQDWLMRIRGSLPGAGGDVEGYTWIGYFITFSDGTTEEIRQTMEYSMLPLSVWFQNKQISSLRVDVKAQLNGAGVSSWTSTTDLTVQFFKKPDTSTARTTRTEHKDNSGSGWISSDVKTLASISFTGSELNAIVYQYGDGGWLLQTNGQVILEATVNGVKLPFDASAPQSGLDIWYDDDRPYWLSVAGGGYEAVSP